jgi:flagellin
VSATVDGADVTIDASSTLYTYSTDGGLTYTAAPAGNARALGTGVTAAADAITRSINDKTTTDYVGLTATAAADGSVTLDQNIAFSDASFTDGGGAAVGTINDNVLTFSAAVVTGTESLSFKINGSTAITATSAANDSYAQNVYGMVDRLQDVIDARADLGGLGLVVATDGTDITVTATANTTTLLENPVSTPIASTTSLSVGTAASSRSAITAIDAAINTVNTQRANLGAVSNRMDSTVANLTNISTNLEAGRSRILDADFAAESTNLAKSQILQQASMAMLAQANASKQGVLSLLQG